MGWLGCILANKVEKVTFLRKICQHFCNVFRTNKSFVKLNKHFYFRGSSQVVSFIPLPKNSEILKVLLKYIDKNVVPAPIKIKTNSGLPQFNTWEKLLTNPSCFNSFTASHHSHSTYLRVLHFLQADLKMFVIPEFDGQHNQFHALCALFNVWSNSFKEISFFHFSPN